MIRRLEQLNSDWIRVYMHQKRFKENLLVKLGTGWSEYSEGRDVYISHKKTVGAACLQVTEDEARKSWKYILLSAADTLQWIIQLKLSKCASCQASSYPSGHPPPRFKLY